MDNQLNPYEMSYPEDAMNMELSTEGTWHPDIMDYPYMGYGNVMGGGGRWGGAEVPVPPNANLYGAPKTRRGRKQDAAGHSRWRSKQDWERGRGAKHKGNPRYAPKYVVDKNGRRMKVYTVRDRYGAEPGNQYEMSYPEDAMNMELSNEKTWHPDIMDYPYMGYGNVMGGGGRWGGAEVPVPPNANLYYGYDFMGYTLGATHLVAFLAGIGAFWLYLNKPWEKW